MTNQRWKTRSHEAAKILTIVAIQKEVKENLEHYIVRAKKTISFSLKTNYAFRWLCLVNMICQ